MPVSVSKSAVCLCCLSVVLLTASGCGDTSDSRGMRVPVFGFVLLDDEPLAAGRIMFISDQGQGQVKATAMIRNGEYQFTEENGPVQGEARVEIHPVEMELEQFEAVRNGDLSKKVDFTEVDIPARYNTNSKLVADVSLDAAGNVYSFELTSESQ